MPVCQYMCTWDTGCLWGEFTKASIWHKNMLRYLSVDIICSEKWTVFQEHSLRKTVSFKELAMSKDKYLSIFLRHMEVIAFIILQIFFTMHIVNIQSHDTCRPIAREGKHLIDYKMGCRVVLKLELQQHPSF